MSERFTEILRAASEPAWSDAVRHRFVNELFAGAVPDAVMARYLIQDHRFLDSFLTLLGATLASADTFEARVRFGRFIGMVSGEENTFFLRAFEALGITEDMRTADPQPRGKPRLSTYEGGCGRETDSPLEGDGFEPSVPREGPTRRDGFIRLSSGGSEAHHRRSAISTARSGRRSPPGP